jgi:aminopeptidase N
MGERTDIASLNQQEAAERAALLEVDRYDVDLDLHGLLEGDTVASTVTVRFRCTRPGEGTFVDCVADIEHATLNGVALDPGTASRGRLPLPGLQADNVLVVASRQNETSASEGILKTVDPNDKLVYVWTSFEPDDARRLWACFDQPDLKAVHSFTVVAPEQWTVLSNTGPTDVAETGGGRMWSFADTPRLSPYVVVVNAGPFHEIRQTRGGYDLGLYCRQSLVAQLTRDADELFDVTEHGLAWFGEKFAMPFPQRRYDQVFVPNMGGAMENWGCVTHGDFMLFRGDPTYNQRLIRSEYVLHEMAHMWFGDLVTMTWWDDLWLNEAFASWASVWALVAIPEFSDAWAANLAQFKLSAYAMDQTDARHPIRGAVPDVAQAMANFDAITYYKGMSVLRQLAAYVGEDAFVSGLQTYFATHAFGNTVLADLMDAIGAAAGVDLDGWTEVWLDHAGTDTLRLADGVLTATSADAGPPRPHRLDIASYDDDGGHVGTTAVTMTGSTTPVDLPDAAVHLLNAGDLTFASLRTDPDSLAWLLARAGDLPDPMARSIAVTTAWDMVQRAELAGPDFVTCVTSVLGTERSPAVAEPFLDLARRAAELWTPTGLIEAQLARVADVAATLATEPEHALPALRTLAACATTDAHFALLDGATGDDIDLAWRVLTRRAELDRHNPAAVTALAERDPDPESWVSALMVQAARPETSAKEKVWQAVMVDQRVPSVETFYDLVTAFWRPSQRDMLQPFTLRFLEAIRSPRGGMLNVFQMLAMYPGPVGDAAFLQAARELADDAGVSPTVTQSIRASNDRLARQLVARAG